MPAPPGPAAACPHRLEHRSPATVGSSGDRGLSARVRERPAGFSGYLGQRLNPDTQAWEERYGKTVKLTFGLDLYAAPGADPAALEQIWAALAQACLPPGPKGLTVGTFSCGETDYDQQARLLKRPAQLVCTALLVSGSTQEQGEFLDFEIRGERTL